VGQKILLPTGGGGGRGNLSVTTSTHRAPREFGPGEPATEKTITLRLKLLADVGLLGLPNAGKSTFVACVSNAKPKIADYPFTTTQPALGMVRHHGTDMVLADLPGLIEGAGQGVGLGHQFLKHVSRCAAVLHLISGQTDDAVRDYQTIRSELSSYDAQFGSTLTTLPEVVAITKHDALTTEHIAALEQALTAVLGTPPHIISSHTNKGVDGVLGGLAALVATRRADEKKTDTNDTPETEPTE
jgi:GTP-binding protein